VLGNLENEEELKDKFKYEYSNSILNVNELCSRSLGQLSILPQKNQGSHLQSENVNAVQMLD
jgi:hypothetical protein